MLKEFLSTPQQVGRFGRFVFFQLKLWHYCVKLLRQNHCGQQAAALSYHTIFGLVPLAIVMLLIFQSLPASEDAADNFKTFVYQQTHLGKIQYPAPDNPEATIKLTDKIDEITSNFFAKLEEEKGFLTMLGGLIVIWAAIGLLTTVERTFNRIWHVHKGRTILQRIVYYWSTLTLAPLLLGLAVYLSARYAAADKFGASALLSFAKLLPYIISVLAFCLLYILMPNTKVSPKAAIWGAAVAALVWTAAKWGFRIYITKFIPYSRLYGIAGLVPLAVLWIYITWVIVLFGLQLTFTTQHLKTLHAAEMAAAQKPQEYFISNDFTAIQIIRQIYLSFRQNAAPARPELICEKLNLPDQLVDIILSRFVTAGLLLKTSEPSVGFVLAAEPVDITLDKITEAATGTGLTQQTSGDPQPFQQIIHAQKSNLAKYSLKQIL